jgi:hypothetical protein
VRLLDVQNVFDRQGDLDAISIVVRPEDGTLDALDPFFGALRGVRPEVIGALFSCDREMDAFLIAIGDLSGDTVSQIDLAMWKVDVFGVEIIRQDVSLEAEPIAVVHGVPLPRLRQVPLLEDLVLERVSFSEHQRRQRAQGLTAFLGRYA